LGKLSCRSSKFIQVFVVLVFCTAYLAIPQGNVYAMPFNPAVNYAAGSNPQDMAVGDFNRDGKPDLVTANYLDDNVSVLLGVGNGNFGAAVNWAVGHNPISVAVGDFNLDGKPDLAVANFGSNNVSISLGIGDGTFNAAMGYTAGSFPRSVAVGDFNLDGKPDLAVANYFSNDVSVLLGVGDGTLGPAINRAVGIEPWFVAVGDFNRDGKPDLAVANSGSSNVSVLLGVGDGTLGAAVNYIVGTDPSSVAVGDFNLDGKPDLAVANSISHVSVLLGVGDGTFITAVNYTVGIVPSSVVVGDFNCDGKPDLATANGGSNDVSVLLGDGNGVFAAAVNYAVGTAPSSVAVGDFNLDCSPDLATANSDSNDVSVLLNTPPEFTVSSVTPKSGNQGQTLSSVVITGNYFVCATAVSFGSGITVNSFTVNSASQITASITIAVNATLGARDVSVTAPGGTGTLPNGFIVLPSSQTGPTHPVSPTLQRQLNQAQMSIQYLSVNPQQTAAGQPVTIVTNVVNTGDAAGNLNVVLKINGQAEQTRMISTGPQATQPVKFTVTKAEPGTYSVDVGGQKGSFTVLDEYTGTSSASPVIGLIAALITAFLITVAVMLFRRRVS
jgi:hypothetical protein